MLPHFYKDVLPIYYTKSVDSKLNIRNLPVDCHIIEF